MVHFHSLCYDITQEKEKERRRVKAEIQSQTEGQRCWRLLES